MTESLESSALAQRVRQLEEENTTLRREVRAGPISKTESGNRRWRAFVSVICIVLAAFLTPVSVIGAWAGTHLLNEDVFVATVAPLVDDPAVQRLIIDETMSAVENQVDLSALTDTVFDSIVDLGMDPAAAAALGLLRQPAANALGALMESSVTAVVESPAFSDVWAASLRGVHRTLTIASTSDGGGVVVFVGSDVGIAVGPLVESVKAMLMERGITAASLIPAVDRTIILGDGQALLTLRAAYPLIPVVTWGLPLLTAALFGVGILCARRRSSAVIGSGVGILLGSAALGLGLMLALVALVGAAGELELAPAALEAIYLQITGSIRHSVQVLMFIGVLIAVLGWLIGPSKRARQLRFGAGSGTERARRSLADRGLSTGALGVWLAKYRLAVRIGAAALGLLWLLLMGPAGIGSMCLVIVITLVVVWLLEVLQPPTEREHLP